MRSELTETDIDGDHHALCRSRLERRQTVDYLLLDPTSSCNLSPLPGLTHYLSRTQSLHVLLILD
jgi:hypothetical protein